MKAILIQINKQKIRFLKNKLKKVINTMKHKTFNKNIFLNRNLLKVHLKIRLILQRKSQQIKHLNLNYILNKRNKKRNINLYFIIYQHIFFDTESH